MSSAPDSPEPEDFKPSVQDVDTEATVTKMASDVHDQKPKVRVSPREPERPQSTARVMRKPQGNWFSRLLKSVFG